VVPAGVSASLAPDGRAIEFLRDQYRHCKPLLVIGDSAALLDEAGIPRAGEDPGLLVAEQSNGQAVRAFLEALAQRRHFERERDPPLV
jgi:catalase